MLDLRKCLRFFFLVGGPSSSAKEAALFSPVELEDDGKLVACVKIE
jgi:hypothetical protein